jgi:hypothetical protein
VVRCEQQFGFAKSFVMRFACRKGGRTAAYFRESKGSLSEQTKNGRGLSAGSADNPRPTKLDRARGRNGMVGAKCPAAVSIIAQLLSLVDLLLSPIDSSDLISIFALFVRYRQVSRASSIGSLNSDRPGLIPSQKSVVFIHILLFDE